MTEEKLYKIMELSTSGWFLVENRAQMLTKEQCDASLTEYQKQGVAPERLMAVLQDDPRYPTDAKETGYIPVDM
tara:strand:- start:1361 stop:1582 length:222 start_codon:yes stop_codon:yes gene_type:complete